jgi:hypothetical protein
MQQDIDQLFEKLANGALLNADEVVQCMHGLETRLEVLKRDNPEGYLSLVENLVTLYETVNAGAE